MRVQWRQLIGMAGLSVAIVAGLIALAAPLTYVTTHGISMEPSLQQGDLVAIRPASSYQVGDVVAYRSHLLNTIVMHRMVERDGDRYLFKGDNNSWIDRDQPSRADLIGTQWLRVPRAGAAIGWFRTRWPLLIAMSLLLVVVSARRRHRRRKLGTHVRDAHAIPSTGHTRGLPHMLLPAAAVCVAAFVALGVLAYASPAKKTSLSEVAYVQRGSFAYAAPAPAGPVYDGGVTTGDPIFLSLVNAVELRFAYSVESTAPLDVSGLLSLTADISDGSGWHHRLELSPPSAFRGDAGEVRAALDVAHIQRLITEVESLTGVAHATHTVSVIARVEVNGDIAGQGLADTFTADLDFQLDALQLRPAWTPADTPTGVDPLAPSQTGSVTDPRTVDRQLAAFGQHLDIDIARKLAVSGTLASGFAMAVSHIVARRRNEVARIDARHGRRIIPVVPGGGDGNGAVVDVTSIADLDRLAEQYGCLILHHDHKGAHSYLFQVDRTIYRYRIPKLAAAAS